MTIPGDSPRPQGELPQQGEVTSSSPPEHESADDNAPEFLKEVLGQTVAGFGSSRELSPEVYQALLDVARRFPGEPLSLDPIAIELVAASLSVQFPAFARRETLSRRMYAWVAGSILDDPSARHRLAELWARLGEAAA